MIIKLFVETPGGTSEIHLSDHRAKRKAAQWNIGEEGVLFEFKGDLEGHLVPLPESADILSDPALSGAKVIGLEIVHVDGRLPHPALLLADVMAAQGAPLERARLRLDAKEKAAPAWMTIPAAATRLRLRVRLTGAGRLAGLRIRILNADDRRAAPVPERVAITNWLETAPTPIRRSVPAALIAAHLGAMRDALEKLRGHARGAGHILEAFESLDGPDGDERARYVNELQEFLDDFTRTLAIGQRRLPRLIRRIETGRDERLSHDPAEGDTPAGQAIDQGVVEAPSQWRAVMADHAVSVFRAQGLESAVKWCLTTASAKDRVALLERFAAALEPIHREAAVRVHWMSFAENPTPTRARSIAGRIFRAGDIGHAQTLIKHSTTQDLTRFIGELRLAAKLWTELPDIPARAVRTSEPTGLDVAYVAGSSLPLRAGGYTIRTHEILRSLAAAGVSCRCYTLPGYPWNRPDIQPVGDPDEDAFAVGDVTYVYTRVEGVDQEPEGFVERLADALETRLRESGAKIVQAASNNRVGLPALIAARRLGVPFIYEVRGLWELTAGVRAPGWDGTERFALDRKLEVLIAKEADHVLSITQGVADELIEGGVSPDRISLLSNAVDPAEFEPIDKDAVLVEDYGLLKSDFVLVYCGSLSVYEGLDDLIEAVGRLRESGVTAKLLIVGKGSPRDSLERQALDRGLGQNVQFVGQIEPSEVQRYLSLADVVALPRKPFRVCEVVSPLKPFEAMAMAKPVVLSDLAALREIVVHGETGLLCKPADPEDLAAVLARLANDEGLRRRLGEAARRWVVACRSWSAHARTLVKLYGELRPDAFAADLSVENAANDASRSEEGRSARHVAGPPRVPGAPTIDLAEA
jgi:glycosyltransferase involved in cell wall biosynthesis